MDQENKKKIKDAELIHFSTTAQKTYERLNGTYESIKMVLKDGWILYHTIYLISNILGIAVHPFFFSFSLSYLIIRSKVLMNVLRAVYEPRWQIIFTIFLLIGVTYIFTLFSYVSFHEDFHEGIENS
jgi:hypothetical protein